MMKTLDTIEQVRAQIKALRADGKTIAFVPTMGNLHQGHIALIEEAKKHADVVIASIFVNPMQFGANEDIDKYPRTLAADQEKLSTSGTAFLFTPTPQIMYPKGLQNQSFVEVPDVSVGHCGESRPGHFRGVATIVCKLFNIVQADVACFGLKDYQQIQVIKTMVEDLSIPINIVAVETVREESGLALSSRNGYLTAEEKLIAPALHKCLSKLASAIKNDKNYAQLIDKTTSEINASGFKTDYINICHARTLAPATVTDKNVVILAAAHLGKARLIDNIVVEL